MDDTDTSHMQIEEPNSDKDAEFSIISTISKRGHDLFSKFVSGLFSDRKPEYSETVLDENYEMKSTWDNETKISTIDDNANEIKMSSRHQKGNVSNVSDDPIESDDKERNELTDTEKTRQRESLENLDENKGCAFNKPIAKTNNAHKVQTISMANLVFFQFYLE